MRCSTQGRLDFPQVPPERHCALGHDVEPGEGLGLCAARSLRGARVAGTRATQRALPHLGGDESFNVAANEPYKTCYWILAETGLRAGEIGALPATNLLLDQGATRIAQSVWHGKIQTVKSKKGNRICEISPLLVEHLRGHIRTWRPNRLGLLFATRNGTPWDTDTVRKRKLYPLLQKLGIERCGFHAFRHGNATAMDQEQVPIATRLNRLGQSDARTTMGYTHAMSQDGRVFAARLGHMLTAGNA